MDKRAGRMFGGVSGLLSNVLVPTEIIRYSAGGASERLTEDLPARARNTFTSDSQCTSENHIEREPIENDFWDIANDLGRIVSKNLPNLYSKYQLWQMWQQIDTQTFLSTDDFAGMWVDFVFEVAWLPAAEAILNAKKYTYLNGVKVRLGRDNIIPESLGKFGMFELSDGSKPFSVGSEDIPNPLTQWHSEINDIVSASQYALDFLREAIQKSTEADNGAVKTNSADKWAEVPEDIKQWAKDIAEDQRLKLEGKTTRDPVRKPIYSNVDQRKRDNPEKFQKALDYLSHINQESNCQG